MKLASHGTARRYLGAIALALCFGVFLICGTPLRAAAADATADDTQLVEAADGGAAAQPAEEDSTASDGLEAVEGEIEAIVGHPYAVDQNQCRMLVLGATPCGGAVRYLAYSALGSDESRLRQLVQRYGVLNNELKRRRHGGKPADCVRQPRPRVVLEDSVCTLQLPPQAAVVGE